MFCCTICEVVVKFFSTDEVFFLGNLCRLILGVNFNGGEGVYEK